MAAATISKSERSYIQAGLLLDPPSRADGRDVLDYRHVSLQLGVSPLANGSAHLNIGGNEVDGAGGTDVWAASKLEVIDLTTAGRQGIVCTVSCSPAAYPHLSISQLEDLQHDLTTVLDQTFSHPCLRPPNLMILPQRKAWLLSLDFIVAADAGNVYDALFMAARAALWDTKVPVTRAVEYRIKSSTNASLPPTGDIDVDQQAATSGFDTRESNTAADFELPDYWDEGVPLQGRDTWPIAITLNLIPPAHQFYLDATSQEELATPLRLLVAFSPPSNSSTKAVRMLGSGELPFASLKGLLEEAEQKARSLATALDMKLNEEDIRRNEKETRKFKNTR
ncbi:hypothetical protein FISHEDRAFT_53943 [Fistulina hepatica ATCC 64428]|uniref:Ribosomal RNA-processing protein 42 n=1 Tax=Fistulina hepatica ATCC 64428 TaxID=1128425 RepID=A0A0D7A052_9AGAR|nr:hypothetical protein FISHEDRAFT_53943 [Fistulina hepatica ATCC 64428]